MNSSYYKDNVTDRDTSLHYGDMSPRQRLAKLLRFCQANHLWMQKLARITGFPGIPLTTVLGDTGCADLPTPACFGHIDEWHLVFMRAGRWK